MRLVTTLILCALAGCSDDSSPKPGELGIADLGRDAQTVKQKSGSACAISGDCEGGVCLTTIVYNGKNLNFHGGYCTKKCQTDPDCGGAGDLCTPFRDAAGNEVARYCLIACPTDGCRAGDYTCTAAKICFPSNYGG